MKLTHVLASAFTTVAIVTQAEATDRYFLDSTATSPNGRYRIDAKSPDNAVPNRRPFASNFTYTLTDTRTNKVVWERKQPMTRSKGSSYAYSAESSPLRVFVTDDGLVTAWLAWNTLLILDPADGHKRGEAEILNAFPKSETDQFVSQTTAGPMWSGNSSWYFLTLPAQKDQPASTYFVIRPYWNHRLVINTASAAHVDLGAFHSARSAESLAGADDLTKRLLTAAIAVETQRSLDTLAAAPTLLKNSTDYEAYWLVSEAAHTAFLLRLTAAEPHLRALEQSFDAAAESSEGLQSQVRQALRAINLTPAPGFGVRVYPLKNAGNYLTTDREHPYNTTVPTEVRTANAARIAAGKSVKELTDLLGCPDAAIYDNGRCYDYDIDAKPGYTLRISLSNDEATITAVRKIEPFAFLNDAARMKGH